MTRRLKRHIGNDDQGCKRKGHTLTAQGPDTNGNNRRIIAEKGNNGAGKEKGNDGNDAGKGRAKGHGKGKALAQAGKFSGAIAKAAHRLKALAKADDDGGGEKTQSGHNGHSGNGRITVGTGSYIETNRSHARRTLAGQGRRTAGNDFLKDRPRRMYITQKRIQKLTI